MALLKASPLGYRNFVILAAGEAIPVGRWVSVGPDGKAYLASGAEGAPRGIGFSMDAATGQDELIRIQVSGDVVLESYKDVVLPNPPVPPAPSVVYYQGDNGFLSDTETVYQVAVGLPDSQVLIMSGGSGGGGGGINTQTVISTWLPFTEYEVNDLFYYQNALYRVRQQHTSTGTFAPGAITVDYELVVLGQHFRPWEPGVLYVAGQCVVQELGVYLCLHAHLSNNFNWDLTLQEWELLFTLVDPADVQSPIQEWKASTFYDMGDLFYFQNSLYRVKIAHTSATTFPTANITQTYEPVLAGMHLDVWQGSTFYVAGQCISIENKVYKCVTTHKSSASPPASFVTDSPYWELLFEYCPLDHTHPEYYSGDNFQSLSRISHDLENWPTWMGAPWPGSKGCSVRRIAGSGQVTGNITDIPTLILDPMQNVILPLDDQDYMANVSVIITALTDTELFIHTDSGSLLDAPSVAAGETSVFHLKTPEVLVSGAGNFSYSYVVEVIFWLGGRADIRRKVFDYEGIQAEEEGVALIFSTASWLAVHMDTPDYYLRSAIEITNQDLTGALPLTYVLSYNGIDVMEGEVFPEVGQEILTPNWDNWNLRIMSGNYRIRVILTYIS